jgi:hypothetical protein
MDNVEFLKLLITFLTKNAPGFFSVLGFLSAILLTMVLRRPVVRMWKKWTNSDDAVDDTVGRRHNDVFAERLIKQSDRQWGMLEVAIREQTNVLRENGEKLERGFESVHRRLDRCPNRLPDINP